MFMDKMRKIRENKNNMKVMPVNLILQTQMF